MDALGSHIGPLVTRRTFLARKIEAVSRKLEKLRYLDSQSALLILRYCVSQELKHLLRCLDPTGLQDLWATLDNKIYEVLDRLRNASIPTSPPPELSEEQLHSLTVREEVARVLYGLPVSLGGVGIASHVTTTPAARGASLETANLSVAAIRAGHAPDCTNVTSQKTRTWKGHNKRLAILLAEKSPLDIPTKVALVDNANPIGGAWL